MDIRIRAFGKMFGYLAIIVGSVAALNWLVPQYSTLIVLGISAGTFLYAMYCIILIDMETQENHKDWEK